MATVVTPPPQPPPAEATPAHRVQAVRARAHFEHVAEEIRPPRWIEGLALFLIAAGVYFWVGYQTVVEDGVVVFDALDRLTRAYMVWHNEPPKLAAIGFVFPPLTTMSFLPFTFVKPLATSLVALPLVSSIFGGWMVVAMNRLLARCSMPGLQRWLLLALFALNPLVVFYAGNGMSEVTYLALLTFSLYCFVSWFLTAQPRFLVAAAIAFSLLVLLRYSFGIWAIVIAVTMAVGLGRRGAASDETEGTLVTFLAPLVYALGVWILFNWLIVGDLLGWMSSSGAFAVNAPQGAGAGVGLADVLERGGQLTLGVFALGIVVVPALIMTAVGKRDEMSWWLSILALTGIVVIGAGALIEQDFDVLAMRNALPVLIVCVAGVGWLYRILPDLRTIVWLAALVGLVLTAIGSWIAMQRYPFQGQEQAFVRAIETGADQDGSNSIGGFRVGTNAEERMAAYINANVHGRSSILTDNAQTFGVILLTGRPQLFFDRVDKGDDPFQQAVQRPYGRRVRHMLMAKRVSGDLIRLRYPTAASRVVAGLTPVFETERYILLALADHDPRSPRRAVSAGGGGRVGGRATAAPGAGVSP